MNAYFSASQGPKDLFVISQDSHSADLLKQHGPSKISNLAVTGVNATAQMFVFDRSDKMITLLRLLGVYGDIK